MKINNLSKILIILSLVFGFSSASANTIKWSMAGDSLQSTLMPPGSQFGSSYSAGDNVEVRLSDSFFIRFCCVYHPVPPQLPPPPCAGA